MSTSTKTGGDTPIVISMDPATTVITTVEASTSTFEAESSSEVTTQPSETVETTMEGAVPTSLTVVEPTTATTHTEPEEESSALSSTSISLKSSTLQTTIVPSSSNPTSLTSTALPSPTSQSKPGLGIAASIGLGVSMGVVAFLVITGVLYAVFGRYLRNMRRNRERRIGATNRNRWWKGRR